MDFVQYYKCVIPADEIDRMLACIFIRWENGDEENKFCGRGSHGPGSGSRAQYRKGWFIIVPIQAVKGNLHILRANNTIKPLTVEHPWTEHRFFINRFFLNKKSRRELQSKQ